MTWPKWWQPLVLSHEEGNEGGAHEVQRSSGCARPAADLLRPIVVHAEVANSMLSGIEFRYQVRGRLCWLREIHSVKEGDADNLALFEFDNGDMLWHSVEEMYREPGDGKVPGGYRLVRNDGRTWL